MNAVFTIVAKNYIGLAGVLEQSVKRASDVDFFIVVADDFAPHDPLKNELSENVLFATHCLDIESELLEEMAFKYNLVEFCTAIKPAAFKYFFNSGKYEKVIYADPDLYFFSSVNQIFDQLENCSILLTPHLLDLQTNFKGDYPDYLFLVNGTFNLGFLGLKQGEYTHRFLDWWHVRLIDGCFFDFEKGMATDQKWINLLPAFFPSSVLGISFQKGMNLAPWNYHERQLTGESGRWMIEDRQNGGKPEPLIFVHFSGYNYKAFLSGDVDHKVESVGYKDLDPLFSEYGQAIANSDFSKYESLSYGYGAFDNGINIISLNRRLFRRLIESGEVIKLPFSTGKDSFYARLLSNGLIDPVRLSPDKLTNKNISGFDKKMASMNFFFKFVKKIIGIRKYSMLIRFFRRYFAEENQIFLLDAQLGKKFQK